MITMSPEFRLLVADDLRRLADAIETDHLADVDLGVSVRAWHVGDGYTAYGGSRLITPLRSSSETWTIKATVGHVRPRPVPLPPPVVDHDNGDV